MLDEPDDLLTLFAGALHKTVADRFKFSAPLHFFLGREGVHRHLLFHGGRVFLSKGRPVNHIRTPLKKTCEAAGIFFGREVKGGFIFHDLRHTFITDMRKAGVSKSVRMSITGHAPKDMDDRYNRVDDQDKHEAIKKLEAFRQSVSKSVSETVFEK